MVVKPTQKMQWKVGKWQSIYPQQPNNKETDGVDGGRWVEIRRQEGSKSGAHPIVLAQIGKWVHTMRKVARISPARPGKSRWQELDEYDEREYREFDNMNEC